jgi:hypothetical protein
MKIKLDNPAGRLLDLIARGQQIPPSKECRLAWCELLSVDPNDMARLTIRLGKVMALLDEIEEAINSCENIRPETYLKFNVNISKAFEKQKLNDHWSSFINYIDEITYNYIEMTSDVLSMQKSEGCVEDERLEEIEKGLQSLVKEVAASKSDKETKEFLARRSVTILDAVQEFRFTGVSGLFEAVCATLGEISIKQGIQEALQKTYTGKKFGELLGKIFFVLKIMDTGHQLPNTLMSLLPESDFAIKDTDIQEL